MYTRTMSTPGTIQSYSQPASTPTAYAGQVASAHFALGQVIIDLIHRAGFHTENEVLDRLAVVEKWIKAVTTVSDRQALATGEHAAPVEDVSLRTPPNTVYNAGPVVTPPINYNKLAEALLPMLQAQQQQANTPAQQ